MSTATDAVSIALPKFLVTTVEMKSQDGDKVVFDRYSKQGGELPMFLVDVKYEDKASVAAQLTPQDNTETKIKTFADEGKGDFSGTAVSQADFTALLAKEGKEVLFYIHGMGQQTSQMVEATDSMQTNFNSQKPEQGVVVVPVDWAADDSHVRLEGNLKAAIRYHPDQKNAKFAGSALWKLFSGLEKENWNGMPLNVIAHSMGNRVLRCVGKSATPEDSSWYTDALQKDTTLLQAAPEDLKSIENLFDNIFFVAADIPESAFDDPDGKHHGEQAEHALQSGVAALAVMTKRMHVLHGNRTDGALNQSIVTNLGNARLGSRGPWSSELLGKAKAVAEVLGVEVKGGGGLGQGERTKVWDKIGDALEEYEGIEKDGNDNNSNVHVQDCSPWNKVASVNGHSYQFAPEAVAYYLKHMTKGV